MGKQSPRGWYYNSSTSKWEFAVYNSSGDINGVFNEDGALIGNGATISKSSASTNGATSIENLVAVTTMTGAGGVGGRSRFQLDTNVALGGWSNALKGMVVYGATGKTAGLGSAICAEMTLSAGTVDGNYAPLELELNLGTGAKTGTKSALIYASVNGDGKGEFDDNGVVLNLQGLAIGAGHAVQASAVSDINSTHALKIQIADTLYYIPLHTAANFGG